MLRNAGEACSISRTRARLRAELSSQSSVSEPPSPPAPLTFQPRAPCAFAISMTRRASVPTRAGWSRPCASVALGHRPAEALEVARVQRVARARRGAAQVGDGGGVRPGVLQRPDDLLVEGRGVVRLAEVDEKEPPLELPPDRVRHQDRRDRGMRVDEHLDVVDPAVGRGELVLDAALPAEHLGLDALCGGSGLVRREAPGGQGVEGADEGHRDRGRGAGARARRRLGVDRHLEPQVARDLHVRDRGFQEGVGPPGWRGVPHFVPLAEVLGVDDEGGPPRPGWGRSRPGPPRKGRPRR